MKAHCRLIGLAFLTALLFCFSVLYFHTQVYHGSLTPHDARYFSCKTSMHIENVPQLTTEQRISLLPRPDRPATKITPSDLIFATQEEIRQRFNGKIVSECMLS